MGNKAAKGQAPGLTSEQLNELMGGSSSSVASTLRRKPRTSSAQSTSVGSPNTLQRKPSYIISPPQSPRAGKLADRWDCERCGCSNEGHLMVCFGCRDIRC